MTLPTLVTVKALVRDANGPVAGRLVFVRSAVLFPAATDDENLLIPEEVVCTVGADGVVSQSLFSSNDPAASPTGWTWEVRPHFPHWRTSFSIVVPYDAVDGEVDLNKLAPVPPDGDGQLYALANHVHEGGGGGGDGPSPSSTVVSGTAYGQAASAGNASTYSRGNHTHGTPALPTPADIGASATGHNHSGTYDPAGTASTAVAAHVAASDPHSQYLTASEGNAAYSAVGHNHDSAYDATGAASSAVAAHVAAGDPHTQYGRVFTWNGSAYAVNTGADVYIGPTDPVADGLWVDTDA